MLVDIVGMRKLDFENEQGEQVVGTQVFGFKDNANGDVKGKEFFGKYIKETRSFKPIFVPEKILDPNKAKLGQYEIEYNMYGGIESMTFIGN